LKGDIILNASSVKMNILTLVGDACLFTAATFCLLVVVPYLALIIGPAVAWFLHERRFNWAVVICEMMGIILGIVVVSIFFILFPLFSNAIGPIGGWEFTVPAIFMITAVIVFLALSILLDINSIRDLFPTRRQHIRLDYARILSTFVIAVFGVIVSLIQTLAPETGVGDAGVFALGAVAVGVITIFAMNTFPAYLEKSSDMTN
jgi:ABC-type tungstate transport system substrate-binding protein